MTNKFSRLWQKPNTKKDPPPLATVGGDAKDHRPPFEKGSKLPVFGSFKKKYVKNLKCIIEKTL